MRLGTKRNFTPSGKPCISYLYQFVLLYGHVSGAEQNPTQETQALVSCPVWKDPLETPSFILDERVRSQQPSREAFYPRDALTLLQGAHLVLMDFNLRCGCFDAVAWFPTALLTNAYSRVEETPLWSRKLIRSLSNVFTWPYTWSAYIH